MSGESSVDICPDVSEDRRERRRTDFLTVRVSRVFLFSTGRLPSDFTSELLLEEGIFVV